MEDFVTWVDTSKLKRTIMQYNDEVSSMYFTFTAVLPPSIAGRFRSFIKKNKVHYENDYSAWMAVMIFGPPYF
jgi:hypothetical protein